jgi:hypothetical protein
MDTAWYDDFILTPRITIPAERAALYRGAARGVFVRVIRSVYVRAEYWAALDYEGRHRARMRAAWLLDPTLVFSHLSAALLWSLPVVGGDLSVPHALGDHSGGSRSRTGLRRHAVGAAREHTVIDGLPVTRLAATCAHVAAGYEPETSVPTLDHALKLGVSRDDVVTLLERTPLSGGRARGVWSTGFADALSGSPGESASRVAFHRLRLPIPELQVRIDDAEGLAGIVDFFWRDYRLVGEFDGLGKYLREVFTDGRDAGEVVVAEKHREDRIRATDLKVARWGWDAARDPSKLRRILSEQGLRAV